MDAKLEMIGQTSAARCTAAKCSYCALLSGGSKNRVLHRSHNRRGTVLIVALGIILIISGLVITLGRSMRIEAMASANYSSSVQAAAVERGAEQYVIGMILQLQQEQETPYELPDSDFAAVKIGDGYFWIVRPDYPNDPEFSTYGLVDEAAKININAVNEGNEPELYYLPDMTQDLADAVLDWDGEQTSAVDSSYGSLPTPYQTKNGDFESVEELLLVNGFTRELLYGQNVATTQTEPQIGLGNSQMQTPTLNTDQYAPNGIADFLTVYSYGASPAGGAVPGAPAAAAPPTGGGKRLRAAGPGSAVVGGGSSGAAGTSTSTSSPSQINIMAAPYEVLVSLFYAYGDGNAEGDASSVIASRDITDTNASDATALLPSSAAGASGQITGNSVYSQFSADIVAVSGDGRALKRVRVVINAGPTELTPVIIYRRDITDRGWPTNMDPSILTNLRAGQGVPGAQDISQVGSSI